MKDSPVLLMNDAAPSQASTKRNCCTPGCRVKTLVSRVVEKLRAEGAPLTIHNFKSKASYIANSFPSITNESRAILKSQALRMWLSDMNSSGHKGPEVDAGTAQVAATQSLCLSVRQPWAWLIVNGWKNVENRTWATRVRGPIFIHASKGMTREDYDACLLFIAANGMRVPVPSFESLERGGIVGMTTILDCVSHHDSEWFVGPFGFVVDDSRPLQFEPCKGALGFFRRTK